MRKAKRYIVWKKRGKSEVSDGSALEIEKPLEMEVRGRDLGAGVPKAVLITSNDIAQAVKVPLRKIIQAIKGVLEQTPPELSADIIDRGIVMSGGTSMLRNFDRLITKATGVPAHVANEPLFCVAKGTGMALDLIASGQRVFVFEKSLS
jgi:rod shape-determining protein MreB